MFSILLVVSVTSMAFLHLEGSEGRRSFIFQNEQCQICTTLKPPVRLLKPTIYNAVPEVALPSPDTWRRLVCDINIEEMDLMKMKIPTFIKRFKNPCWHEGKDLRCLPYMHLVGTAKSGTTDFFERISRHPDFVKPTRKEPSWLSSGRFYRQESFSFYTATFFSPIAERQSNMNGSSNLITGDASVFDLHGGEYWPFLGENVGHDAPVENNPEYIYHLNSRARILILVRNPIDRLWSEYLAMSKTGNISAESFHEAVLNAVGMYKECLQSRSLRSCMYDEPLSRRFGRRSEMLLSLRRLLRPTGGGVGSMHGFPYIIGDLGGLKSEMRFGEVMTEDEKRHFASIENCRYSGYQMVALRRGVYHVFIRDYLKVFPRNHVLILRTEDVSKDMKKYLLQTFQFLGLERPNETVFNSMLYHGRHNARRPSNIEKGDMLDATRRILYEFYRPHNQQLATMLGDSNYNYGLKEIK